MQDLISWNASFETGLPTVDEQHRELVRLTNQLGRMMVSTDGSDLSEIDNIFVQLANYAKFHFAEEEQFMARAEVPQGYLEEHKREHRDFVEKVSSLWTNRHKDPKRTFATLSAFLQTWVCKHILVTDREMARQVRMTDAA